MPKVEMILSRSQNDLFFIEYWAKKKKKKNYMQLDSQKKGTNIIGRVPITCFVGLFFFF